MVNTPRFQCREMDLTPGWGTINKILNATQQTKSKKVRKDFTSIFFETKQNSDKGQARIIKSNFLNLRIGFVHVCFCLGTFFGRGGDTKNVKLMWHENTFYLINLPDHLNPPNLVMWWALSLPAWLPSTAEPRNRKFWMCIMGNSLTSY